MRGSPLAKEKKWDQGHQKLRGMYRDADRTGTAHCLSFGCLQKRATLRRL